MKHLELDTTTLFFISLIIISILLLVVSISIRIDMDLKKQNNCRFLKSLGNDYFEYYNNITKEC